MDDEIKLPIRKSLPHSVPDWVKPDSIYFITICAVPKGTNQLCHDIVANRIKDSILEYQNFNKWWIHYILFMPDHIHGLISFNYSPDMKHTISSWKKYIARMYNINWQRDFFDHRLRKEESYLGKEEYISMNPVRAGLVKRSKDWKYSWTGDELYG